MNASQPRRWYLAKSKQRLGPFTADQLQRMVASGHLQFADMLLEEGQPKWRPAGEIQGLFAIAIPVEGPGRSVESRPHVVSEPAPAQPHHARFFLTRNKQRLGPFTHEQLEQMTAAGEVQSSDMVLEEGKQRWRPFGEVLAPKQMRRRPLTYAKGMLAGLATVTAMVLLAALWALGVFGSKPPVPKPVQQAQAGNLTGGPGEQKKDERDKPQYGTASVADPPKTTTGAGEPAAPSQEPPAQAKQQRAEALADVRDRTRIQLQTASEEIRQLTEKLVQIDQLLAAKTPQDLPPDELGRLRKDLEKSRKELKKAESPGQLPTLIVEEDILRQKRNEWNGQRRNIEELLRIAEKKLIEASQEERKVLVRFPEAGDPTFLERNGLLYTEDELFHESFIAPFRAGALGQITGTVIDVNVKRIEIRYTLLLFDRRPGHYRPEDIEVRFYNQTLDLSDITDVRIQSTGPPVESQKKAAKENEKPGPSNTTGDFPTPAEIKAKQLQGIPADPKDIYPGGATPGGFSPRELGQTGSAIDDHGNPIYTEEMIRSYPQAAIKDLQKGQEVSAFFSNDGSAVVIVILPKN